MFLIKISFYKGGTSLFGTKERGVHQICELLNEYADCKNYHKNKIILIVCERD